MNEILLIRKYFPITTGFLVGDGVSKG